MKYKELSKIFYSSKETDRAAQIEHELDKRLNASSTFRLDFQIKTGELFIAVPQEMTILTERILRRERKISKLMQQLPGIAGDEVLRSLAFDEVISSNEIENIHSTRKEIEKALREKSGTHKTQRFKEFARLYLDMIFSDPTLPTTPQDVRKIYDKIMNGEKLDDEPDGKIFRKDEVYVWDETKQIHVGLLPEEKIIDAISKMLDIANSDEIPAVYGAIAAHFIFEYAHPFYDGNGRTGRYLLSLFLAEPLSKPTILSLSRAIAGNKAAYYKAFDITENPLNHAELTFFVYTILKLIMDAQEELIERLNRANERCMQLILEYEKLENENKFGEKEISIIFVLAQQAEFGMFKDTPLDEVAEYVSLGKQQTRKYMTKLIDMGVVEKVNERNPITFALTDDFFNSHFAA